MEFKLEPNRRNIPNKTLLNDLLEVSKRLCKKNLSQTDYNTSGTFSSDTIRSRFGSWNTALEKAGLQPSRWDNVKIEQYSKDLKRVAKLLGKAAITQAEYNRTGKYSSTTICRRFKSWLAALKAAGLQQTRDYGLTNEDLFSNLEKVWRTLGRQPRHTEMHKPLSAYSGRTYEQRFRTWRQALEAFVDYANREPASSSNDSQPKKETHIEFQPNQKVQVPKKSRYISWRLRFLVMRRDGFRCCKCGRSPTTEPGVVLHIDHTEAWSKDGPTIYDNLQTLCSVCNIGKSDLDDSKSDPQRS